jgi:hypothetical protein
MDFVLLTITVGSLSLAVGLGVIGWKLLRHGHAEMDTRVEHLRALAAAPAPLEAPEHTVVAQAPLVIVPVRDVMPVHALLSTFASDDDADADETERDWDAALGHEAATEASEHLDHVSFNAPLFAAPGPSSAPTRRLALVGAVSIVMLGSAGTAYAVYRPQTMPAHRVAADAGTPSAAPLDLLSLNQTIDAEGTFVVTGLVGNPPGGHAADRVMAVVYLFDREGHYFATGRAGLDEAALGPGDQSPFVVKIAHGTNAARYRIGFRQLDGAVVAHVDKRGQALEGTTEVTNASKGSGQ